jgi:hypothetical protein
VKQNPVADYSCPVKKSKRKKLTFEQLIKLEQKEFQDPALLYVRDLFLFSCYKGLHMPWTYEKLTLNGMPNKRFGVRFTDKNRMFCLHCP